MKRGVSDTDSLLVGGHQVEAVVDDFPDTDVGATVLDDDGITEVAQPERWWDLLAEGSVKASTFELVSATLGAGCLALPFAMQLVGVIEAFILLIAGAGSAIYSMHLLVVVRDHYYPAEFSRTYEALVRHVFGVKAEILLEAMIVAFCWGTCIVYVLVVRDMASPQLKLVLGEDSFFARGWFVMLVVSTLVMLPLASLKNVSALRFTSFTGILALLFLSLSIGVRTIQSVKAVGLVENVKWFDFSSNIFLAMPIVMFAFASHVNLFSIYDELHAPSSKRIHNVVYSAVSLAMVLYILIGMAGYFGFQGRTCPNILNNYDPRDYLMMAANIAIAITVSLNYPLSTHPCRITLTAMLGERYPFNQVPERVMYWIFTFGMVYLAWGVAALVPGIDDVFGLLGATATAIVCYIMPALLYIRCMADKYPGSKWYAKHNWGALVVAIVGTAVGIISTVIIIVEWARGDSEVCTFEPLATHSPTPSVAEVLISTPTSTNDSTPVIV